MTAHQNGAPNGTAPNTTNGTKHDNGTALSRDAATALRVSRDFRSDTFTAPTRAMFEGGQLMEAASRGDDVYGEDESTNELQDRIARLAGKEAGLYCVSGTMTNQLAIRSHLKQPPHSVLCDSRAHIHCNEAGGIAFHSQATSIAVKAANGHHLTLEDDVLPNLIEGENVHVAPVRLVCLENTLSGMVFPQDEVIKISEAMRAKGVIMHCDGARMWEASAKTGLSLRELCEPFESVSLCLSKGMGAPVGSVLVGSKEFINRARWFRKLFGGGTRQCGSLAAAANYCLDYTFPRLPRVHELATRLATSFAQLGAHIVLPTETNMVFLDPSPLGFSMDELGEHAGELPQPIRLRGGGCRLVLHHQITAEAVNDLVELASKLKSTNAKPDATSLKHAQGHFVDGDLLREAMNPSKQRKQYFSPSATQSVARPSRGS